MQHIGLFCNLLLLISTLSSAVSLSSQGSGVNGESVQRSRLSDLAVDRETLGLEILDAQSPDRLRKRGNEQLEIRFRRTGNDILREYETILQHLKKFMQQVPGAAAVHKDYSNLIQEALETTPARQKMAKMKYIRNTFHHVFTEAKLALDDASQAELGLAMGRVEKLQRSISRNEELLFPAIGKAAGKKIIDSS